MRLESEAGVVMSWEPDCSPQVMTTSLEPHRTRTEITVNQATPLTGTV
jgi:hypothetical protein